MIFISGSFLACGSVKDLLGTKVQSRKFSIDKKWVTTTLLKDHLGYRHPHRMTPIIVGTNIIQGNGIDGIGAYDRKTGQERWHIFVKGGVEGGATVVGDKMYFGGSDGLFYGADPYSGQINWTFPVKAEVLSQPLVEKGTVFFIAGNNKIYALAAEDGKQKWLYSRREASTLSIRGGSQPAMAGSTLYLGFSDGYLVALNADSGQVKWEKSLNRNRRFRDVDASPVIEGDRLYIGSFDDQLYCLDRETGKTLWSFEEGGFSRVTLTAKKLFYATTEGEVVALEKSSGKEFWRYRVPKGLATQPQVFRGLVVFGEYEGKLRVLDAETGGSVGGFAPGRGIMSSPLIDSETGEVYFISVNANLFSLKLGWQRNVDKWPWEN